MTKQEYLMIVAMEECAEVAQTLSKCIRFGTTKANLEDVRIEFNDLVSVLEMADSEGPENFAMLSSTLMQAKKEKVISFMPENLK